MILRVVAISCCPVRPDTFSHQHASAMHWATWGGHTEIVKLLLEHKVGRQIMRMYGKLALTHLPHVDNCAARVCPV